MHACNVYVCMCTVLFQCNNFWTVVPSRDRSKLDPNLGKGLNKCESGPGDHIIRRIGQTSEQLATNATHITIKSDGEARPVLLFGDNFPTTTETLTATPAPASSIIIIYFACNL